jgi:hypothetical protein
MLDGKAFKALLSEETDSDLIPRLRDPALLKAFAALADDLKTVVSQIASGKEAVYSASTLSTSTCTQSPR